MSCLIPNAQGKAKQVESEEESVDSMVMDVDMRGSDFDEPVPKKKTAARASTKKAVAPVKNKAKAPTKGKGKKVMVCPGPLASELWTEPFTEL